MEDKKYLSLLKEIAAEHLPAKYANRPDAVFTASKNNAVLADLKSIKGKNYGDLTNDSNLIAAAKDAFAWNKFLLKQKFSIDVEADVRLGKYTEEEAFKLTTIYGHKGAARYLAEKPAAVKNKAAEITLQPLKPAAVTQAQLPQPQIPELLAFEVQLNERQKAAIKKLEQNSAYEAFRKIETGAVTNPIKRKMLISANNLYDDKQHAIHSCFDDAAYFNSRFGFTSTYADPLLDAKHSMAETMNNNFSLAHWGFKKQNEHVQTSGFGSSKPDNSHLHKDYHLDQPFINRTALTIGSENGQLLLQNGNFNLHKLYDNGNSLMANYNFEGNSHVVDFHGYKAGNNNSGIVYGTKIASSPGISTGLIYSGYNKDYASYSFEVSPLLTYSWQKDSGEHLQLSPAIRFSQSMPLKIFSNKQNVGIMNSSVIYPNAFENSSSVMLNSNLLNVHFNYTFKHADSGNESTLDAHVVYNPFRKFAFYGNIERESLPTQTSFDHGYGIYYSPKQDVLLNFGVTHKFNSNAEAGPSNGLNLGLHKILNNKNVISLEAELDNKNFLPNNIQAKLNFRLP